VTQANGLMQELVRAATETGNVRDQEKRRLLERAVVTIRDLRDDIQRWPGPHVVDAVDGLDRTAALLREDDATEEQVQAALLDAADMIRDLLVVREVGTEPKIEA
jgi:hypothetical protein